MQENSRRHAADDWFRRGVSWATFEVDSEDVRRDVVIGLCDG